MWVHQTFICQPRFWPCPFLYNFVAFLVLVFYRIFMATFCIVVDLRPFSCHWASFTAGFLAYDFLSNFPFSWCAIFFLTTNLPLILILYLLLLMCCLPLMRHLVIPLRLGSTGIQRLFIFFQEHTKTLCFFSLGRGEQITGLLGGGFQFVLQWF